MKVVWINGWGIGISYLETIASELYPNKEHSYILPKLGWDAELSEISKNSTVVAYSLGAFLLLNQPNLYHYFDRVIFLAPFEDFKKEEEKGGKVYRSQLIYLRRWLQRDSLAAIRDFVLRAGLSDHSDDLSGLEDSDLIWGVDRLINDSVRRGNLVKVEAWIGENDRLLDAGRINSINPSINVLKNVGHDLRELLVGAKIEL